MSKRELRRVGVLARVASEELKLVDAAKILSLSYRQVKRIWRRYEKEGAEGLKHRSAGRESNRAKPKKFRARVVKLLRKKYSGAVGERFGPTLAYGRYDRNSKFDQDPGFDEVNSVDVGWSEIHFDRLPGACSVLDRYQNRPTRTVSACSIFRIWAFIRNVN
jgi:transposase